MSTRFDAESEVYTRAAALGSTSQYSICGWFKISVDRNAFSTFFAVDNGQTDYDTVQTDTDGTTLILWNDGSGSQFTAGPLTPGTWYFIALARNGTAATLYWRALGEASLSSIAITGNSTNIATFRIGNSAWAGEWFNGCTTGDRFWTGATLTGTEFLAESQQIEAVRTTNLYGEYHLEVPETTDYSGNSNTLTGGTGASTEVGPNFVAPAKVADRGSLQNLTSQTATPVDMAAAGAITVGNYLIARIAANNSGTNGAACTLTVSETRSNVWTVLGPALQDPGAADAGQACYIAYTKVVNAYTNGDDITFNWSPTCTGRALVIEEWTKVHSVAPVAVAATTANGASATPSISRTPTAADQVFYGALAIEGPAGDTYTQDSDTTNGTWESLTNLSTTSGTAASNCTTRGAVKAVTAAGAQTWNPAITSRDWAAVALVLSPPNALRYVDNAASGANNGTSWTDAWQSFAAINWASIGPGDTLYISGGTVSKTYAEALLPNPSNTNPHGTLAAPITITRGVDSGHTGQPILTGSNTRVNCIEVGGYTSWAQHYLTFRGLRCENATENPIWIRDCTGVVIDDCEIEGPDNASFSQAIFANENTDFTVRNCTITTVASTVGQADGIYLQDNLGTTLIEDNTITISNTDNTGHSDVIQAHQNGATIIRRNFLTTSTAGADNHGMWLHAFTTGTTTEVYNNVVVSRNASAPITVWRVNDAAGHGQVDVYNNTFYGGARGVNVNRYTNLNLKNNIIQPDSAGTAVYQETLDLTAANVTHNLLNLPGGANAARTAAGSNRTYAQWTATDGYNASGLNDDPDFTTPGTNFVLLDTSPAIDTGTTLGTVATDIIGTARPQFAAYDIGAYESLVPADTGTDAPAGNASGTGTAQAPAVKVAPNAGNAAATGAAQTPTVSTSQLASAGTAAGTGVVAGPTVRVSLATSTATGVGVANAPSVSTSQPAAAGPAAGVGTAHDPTVSTAVDANAPAGVAAGVGTASDPTVSTSPNVPAAVATGTGDAGAPTVTVSPLADPALGSGTALDPSISTAQPANAATATGSGAANDATVTTQTDTNATPGTAAGTGLAHDPALALTINAGTALGTGTANDPTSNVAPTVGVASGTGAAHDPALATDTNIPAGLASGTGVAFDATTATAADTNATPTTATGTGTAHGPSATVAANAATATGTGTAPDPAAAVGADTGAAQGSGQAHDPTVSTSPSAVAGIATGVGVAQDATTATEADTNVTPGTATGTGVAQDPTAELAVNTTTATGTGAAHQPAVDRTTPAGTATGTGQAFGSLILVTVIPPLAAGIGAAHTPGVTTASGTFAQAGVATGLGQAWDPGTSTTFTAGVAQGTGQAHQPTVVTIDAGARVISLSGREPNQNLGGTEPNQALRGREPVRVLAGREPDLALTGREPNTTLVGNEPGANT